MPTEEPWESESQVGFMVSLVLKLAVSNGIFSFFPGTSLDFPLPAEAQRVFQLLNPTLIFYDP